MQFLEVAARSASTGDICALATVCTAPGVSPSGVDVLPVLPLGLPRGVGLVGGVGGGVEDHPCCSRLLASFAVF